MSHKTLVIGLFENTTKSEQALSALYSTGLSQGDVELVALDERLRKGLDASPPSRVGEGAAIGAGIAGSLGAIIAGFAAVGTIVTTGGAGLLIAGPLVSALAGAGAGAAAGAAIGGLIGLGIPEKEASFWGEHLGRGGVVLGVKADNEVAERVKSIFTENGAIRVTTKPAPHTRAAASTAEASRFAAPTGGNGATVRAEDWKKQSAMHRLFLDQLCDVYYAEQQLITALATLEEKASLPELAGALRDHRAQTEEHVVRLREVFGIIHVEPEEKTCPAINGIISEARELAKLDKAGPTRDAAIICAAQKAEHYEIGTYGCLRTYASTLGLPAAAEVLNQTLEEEWAADQTLTDLAESGINERAMSKSS